LKQKVFDFDNTQWITAAITQGCHMSLPKLSLIRHFIMSVSVCWVSTDYFYRQWTVPREHPSTM